MDKKKIALYFFIAFILIPHLLALFSPTWAVRQYIQISGYPIQAWTASVEKGNMVDPMYGQSYKVQRFFPWHGGVFDFIYVKRTSIFYVVEAGTGP